MTSTTHKPDTKIVEITFADPTAAAIFAALAEKLASMDKQATHHHIELEELNGEHSYTHHLILVAHEGDDVHTAAEAVAATFWNDPEDGEPLPTPGPDGYETDHGARIVRVRGVTKVDNLTGTILASRLYSRHVDDIAHMLDKPVSSNVAERG